MAVEWTRLAETRIGRFVRIPRAGRKPGCAGLPRTRDAGGDLRDDVQVVGGGDHRLPTPLGLDDEVYERPLLRDRVRLWLVEQEHLRSSPARMPGPLSSSRRRTGRRGPCGQAAQPERAQGLGDGRLTVSGIVHLEGRRHLVLHAGLKSWASQFWNRIPTSFRKYIRRVAGEERLGDLPPKARSPRWGRRDLRGA